MRKLLAVALLAVAGSASAQTWSNDQFSVSTDNLTFVSIVDGTAVVQGLPQYLTLSNPGSDANFPPTFFDLAFSAQPGYALRGETVSFSTEMDVGEYTKPSNMLIKAFASFAVGADGVSSLSESSEGGKSVYSASFFVSDPNLIVEASAVTREGVACPLGDEANGCNYGIALVFLDSAVYITSLSVTPLLSAVPEPGMAAMWVTAFISLVAGALATRRSDRRLLRAIS